MSAAAEYGVPAERPLRRSWLRVSGERRNYLAHLSAASELPAHLIKYRHTMPWPVNIADSDMHIVTYFSAKTSAGIVIQVPQNTWISAPLRSKVVGIDNQDRGFSAVTMYTLEEPQLCLAYGYVNTETISQRLKRTGFYGNSVSEVAAGEVWGTAGRPIIDHQEPEPNINILTLLVARQPLAGTTIYRSDLIDPILLLKRLY